MNFNPILMAEAGETIDLTVGVGTCAICHTMIFGHVSRYTATDEWLVRNGELARIFLQAPDAPTYCQCQALDRFIIYTGIRPNLTDEPATVKESTNNKGSSTDWTLTEDPYDSQ